MIDFSRLERMVMRDEGLRLHPYKDSEGVWTIGYGSTRIYGAPVNRETPPITEPQARQMLRADLYAAVMATQDLFPTLEEMSAPRQEVLVNMTYNLGRAGLGRFVKLRKAASDLDYLAMAFEMRNSKWFDQVGRRSERLVEIMTLGSYPYMD